jgi:hypothetical protein
VVHGAHDGDQRAVLGEHHAEGVGGDQQVARLAKVPAG